MEFKILSDELRLPQSFDSKLVPVDCSLPRPRNEVVLQYLPHISQLGQYQLPGRDASLLNLKVEGKSARFTYSVRKFGKLGELHLAKLGSKLSTSLGLSPKDSALFLSRGVDVIDRTEEEIKGIVDALLLFDVSLFASAKGYALMKALLRRIFKTCTYNVDEVTRQWKNFSQYVWNKASRAEVLEELEISRENVFRRLLEWWSIKDLVLNGITSKRQSEGLAHLTSTRQLVAGGRRTMRKAKLKFRETVTTLRDPEGNLDHLTMAAKKVGAKCRNTDVHSYAHISLSTAGSYESTVKQGGRQSIIRKEIYDVLTVVPEETKMLKLALGYEVSEVAGIPRWQTWARPEPIWTDGDFGEERDDYSMLGEVRYWGYDDALGKQIFLTGLYCATRDGYLSMRGEVLRPINARSSAVPEPGGKTRIVTTSIWWNTILQQPAGHRLKAALQDHPSAEAGLIRADQAWLYINLLRKADPLPGAMLLSSDLEEATDVLIHRVIRRTARGFISGARIIDPLVELGLNLVLSERLIEMDDASFVSKQGILMGEPMTKSLLTLYNLVMEELAIRQYLGTRELPFTGPVNVSWRAFAVGGDDHIAHGPRDYLRFITSNHVAYGSKISKPKHSMSSVAVKYCEKIIHFSGANLKISARDINSSTEMYNLSVFTDSVKVRLLAPISKSIEVKNDRNIAIGKAISIGKTLRWLNTEVFPRRWVEMVRARFIRRMKHYLPKEGTTAFYQILLPQSIGGLDLYLKGEMGSVILKSPSFTQYFVYKALQGDVDPIYARRLKMVTTNAIERGFHQEDAHYGLKKQLEIDFFDRENIQSRTLLQEEGSEIRPENIFECRDRLGLPTSLTMRDLINALQKRGIMTLDEIIRQTMRGELFQDMLLSKGEPRSYSTIPWKKRFDALWAELEASSLFDKEKRDEVRANLINFAPRFAEIENIDRYLPLMVRDVSEEITSWSFVEGEPVMVMENPIASYSRDLPLLDISGLEANYSEYFVLSSSNTEEPSLMRTVLNKLSKPVFLLDDGSTALADDFSLGETNSIQLLKKLS